MEMADRDRWVEMLKCPECGGTGKAELSTLDGRSWVVRVDSVPEGFKVVQSKEGNSNFYCASCYIPVEP